MKSLTPPALLSSHLLSPSCLIPPLHFPSFFLYLPLALLLPPLTLFLEVLLGQHSPCLTLPSPSDPWHVLGMRQKDRDSMGSSHELPLKPASHVIASSFIRRVEVSQTPPSSHLCPSSSPSVNLHCALCVRQCAQEFVVQQSRPFSALGTQSSHEGGPFDGFTGCVSLIGMAAP